MIFAVPLLSGITKLNGEFQERDLEMKRLLMSTAIVMPLFMCAAKADQTLSGATIQLSAPMPPERPTEVDAQSGPVTGKARVDAATNAYDAAANDYVALVKRTAMLEAMDAKSKISARLAGNPYKRSPEVQAAYDLKDVAEAKMKACESIMDAAIKDMVGDHA